MEGRHLDQIAKSLAAGVSRRTTVKMIAAALGLSAAGTFGQPTTTVAQCTTVYCECFYQHGDRIRGRCVAGDSCAPIVSTCRSAEHGNWVYIVNPDAICTPREICRDRIRI
jgi:hypothetical protein